MRIVLFGYGEMGCCGLEFLLAQGEEVAAVVTHRDDPGEKRWYRSLAEVATAAKVPLIYGEEADLKDAVGRLRPELILSFYYRNMIPMAVLGLAPRGALNLHGSKLPRLRGRAPINWALVEGEEETGVTLHHMVKAPDAGDIVAQRAWRIGPRDTARDLFFRAVDEAKLLLRDVWPAVRAGTAPRLPQDATKATYRGRRRPDDGRIDWSQPTKRIDGLVRAVTDPFPGAFTTLGGRKLMVWQGVPAAGKGPPGLLIEESLVATGDGAYRIERCEFPDDPSARPVLRKGTKLGE
ncbi:MAG: formyltransferase [Planctomycetes bacterium]|nr:formyltransferase [Planctomycetota bacterium]